MNRCARARPRILERRGAARAAAPPDARAAARALQVTSDVGKFAGDEVITEQTTQTLTAVLGNTETLTDTAADAIAAGFSDVRRRPRAPTARANRAQIARRSRAG